MSKNPEEFQVPPPYTPAGAVQTGAYPPQGQQYPAGYAPQGGQTVIVTPTGNCPNCHVGFMVETFSLCGILWLILCFPCGLICFLTMKDRKCGHCGYEVHDS